MSAPPLVSRAPQQPIFAWWLRLARWRGRNFNISSASLPLRLSPLVSAPLATISPGRRVDHRAWSGRRRLATIPLLAPLSLPARMTDGASPISEPTCPSGTARSGRGGGSAEPRDDGEKS